MAKRPFIFRGGSTELVLPVTPGSYKVDKGVNVEVVNIHELGDVILMGYGTLATIKISCLLPAKKYPFSRSNDPGRYIEQFERWTETRQELRFIVGNTGVNIPVKIENISWGEQDGTNDVYADIILREYRKIQAVQIAQSAAASKARAATTKAATTTDSNYTIKYGDTLSSLCRKHYGDGTKATYDRLAKYNGIANPNIIYAGSNLKIPQPLP